MSNHSNRNLHHRRSVRLRSYNYAQAGIYFVTICTAQRICWFEQVVGDVMRLSADGQVVEEECLRCGEVRSNVALDAFVVMLNHLHGLVVIHAPDRGVSQYAPTPPDFTLRLPSQTLGAIVRGFKSAVTKRINMLHDTTGISIWQRNYYDHNCAR